jgi:hypothetical protein
MPLSKLHKTKLGKNLFVLVLVLAVVAAVWGIAMIKMAL